MILVQRLMFYTSSEQLVTGVVGSGKGELTQGTVADGITVGRVIQSPSSPTAFTCGIRCVVTESVASNKHSIPSTQSRRALTLM